MRPTSRGYNRQISELIGWAVKACLAYWLTGCSHTFEGSQLMPKTFLGLLHTSNF